MAWERASAWAQFPAAAATLVRAWLHPIDHVRRVAARKSMPVFRAGRLAWLLIFARLGLALARWPLLMVSAWLLPGVFTDETAAHESEFLARLIPTGTPAPFVFLAFVCADLASQFVGIAYLTGCVGMMHVLYSHQAGSLRFRDGMALLAGFGMVGIVLWYVLLPVDLALGSRGLVLVLGTMVGSVMLNIVLMLYVRRVLGVSAWECAAFAGAVVLLFPWIGTAVAEFVVLCFWAITAVGAGLANPQ